MNLPKRSLDYSPSSSSKSKVLKRTNSKESVPSVVEMQFVSKDQKWIVYSEELQDFFHLIERDEGINYFLSADFCCRLADNYLLAMVFVYFKRAKLRTRQFSRQNFYVALYLAHDIEEEDDCSKVDLLKWALGPKWNTLTRRFLTLRDQLWNKMNFRAIVSRKLCNEIMSLVPGHFIWKRLRFVHHAGAFRCTDRPSNSSSIHCTRCLPIGGTTPPFQVGEGVVLKK